MVDVPLKVAIVYAMKNVTLIELTYNGQVRLIEPYSFRVSSKGDELLYGFCYKDQRIEAFRVDRIEHAKATTTKFSPRYPVEVPE